MFDDVDRKTAPKEVPEESSHPSESEDVHEQVAPETKSAKAESKNEPKSDSQSLGLTDGSENDLVSLVHTMELITQRVNSSIEKITAKLEELNGLLVTLTKRIDAQSSTKDPIQQRLVGLSNTVLGETIAALEKKNILPPQKVPVEEQPQEKQE